MKTRTFTLPEADWNIIMQALAELPFRASAPIIQRIQEQAQAMAQEQAHPAPSPQSMNGFHPPPTPD